MSDINQDDIDKLLQDALVGGEAEKAPPPPPEEERGAASQDDIDALFAAAGGAAPEPAPPPPPAPAEEPAAEDEGGVANQDDIDALFSAVADAETGHTPETAKHDDGDDTAAETKDDLNARLESQLAEADAEADAKSASATDTADLDALLSSIVGEDGGGSADDTVHMDGPASVRDKAAEIDTADLDEILKEVAGAAPPPPPPKPMAPEAIAADTAILDMSPAGISQALSAGREPAPPMPSQSFSPPPPPPAPPPPPPAIPVIPPPATAGERREYSVLYGAGEVESVANQISALISSLSEKAHGYMQAWIAADSEAKELRSRALAEERRRSALEGEKSALSGEIDGLRSRLGQLEGAKVAGDESRRTLEASFQAKIRELENQVKLLGSEAESLKDELTRARTQATGVDIESRRARFEVDRLKNEVESERMERLRIQRALENREKELQATQAQASGQASSLFIDELHRLVRRLESELDVRSSGAHEALKQLDRLETPETMVPVVANLRAALMQAMGNADDANDAIKALGREAAGVRGPAALAPGKSEVLSFETALSTYNLVGAVDIAGTLLREAKATPGLLMRKIYQCPALRRPEVADHLGDLARLLEGLRTVQEASDRSRGSESGESEVFYVHMFDFLHNLVRLKLVSRLTGDMWRLFLDLRGRFSFVTSDKQWAEYRDGTLGGKSTRT